MVLKLETCHIIADSFPSVSTSVAQSARHAPSAANRFHSESVFVFPRDAPQKRLWRIPAEPLRSARDTRRVCFHFRYTSIHAKQAFNFQGRKINTHKQHASNKEKKNKKHHNARICVDPWSSTLSQRWT